MGYTELEKEIIDEIANYCQCHCDIEENCALDECILFRIKKKIKGD